MLIVILFININAPNIDIYLTTRRRLSKEGQNKYNKKTQTILVI